MSNEYSDYLSLLTELGRTLDVLTEISQKKTDAVRHDDLNSLNECIKKEQALSLSLRGCEKRRMNMVSDLGLEDTGIRDLADHYPSELKAEAKIKSEELLRQYQLYRSAAEVARSTLECNLHQIEKVLVQAEPVTGPGYKKPPASPEPPASMKTDFRA